MHIKNIDQTDNFINYKGNNLTFEFITDPNEVKQISLKENQINFLKEEIILLKINEQLQSSDSNKKLN